jgi:hypothetical protein
MTPHISIFVLRHCYNFIRDHKMDDIEEFDAQIFFETTPEEDIIEFFQKLYKLMGKHDNS